MDSNGSPAADADLAMAVAAGDRKALAAIFDRYAPRLLAFSQSMLHNRADAEDCLQDIFILTATRISGLREPDRLRSWLFSIARHECLRRLDRRTREVLVDAVPDDNRPDRSRPAPESPTGAMLDNELAALLADAIAGLADRDRLVLDLADRQGLATDEVAAALSMSPSSAYKLLTRARATARKSIGALLVARTGRENCPELNALLGNWNGSMTPLLRKRVARHIEECSLCQEQEKRVASPAALLGAGTAFAMPIPIGLRSHILDTAYEAQTRSIVTPPADPWPGGWPPRSPNLRGGTVFGGSNSDVSGSGGPRSGGRGPAFAVAAAVVVLLLIGAFVAIGRPSVSPEAIRGPLPAISPSSQDVSSSRAVPGAPTTPTTATPTVIAPVATAPPRTRSSPPTRTSPTTTRRTTGPTTAAGTSTPGTTEPPNDDPGTTDPGTSESTSTEPSTRTSRTTATTPRTSASSSKATTSKTTTSPSTPRTSTTTRRTTSTTKTTPTTPTTSSQIDTAPHITQMSVVCQYSKADGGTYPILSWTTTNTQTVELSIDNPGVIGSYGSGYPPSGQLQLPPNGCDPAQGTQVYTLYAMSDVGPTAQRTINWVPPTTATTPAADQPTATSSTATTTSQPPIR